jgi:hypothetical protein
LTAILCHSELLAYDPYCAMINHGEMEAVITAKFKLVGFNSPLH